MYAPSRMTVTVSQRAKISSKRCEMNSSARPSSRRLRATANSRSTSTPLSAAVGSSMISTLSVERDGLGDLDDLLVGDREALGDAVGVERDAEPGEDLLRLLAHGLRSMRPSRVGWRPMKMFSVTERSGKSVGSW